MKIDQFSSFSEICGHKCRIKCRQRVKISGNHSFNFELFHVVILLKLASWLRCRNVQLRTIEMNCVVNSTCRNRMLTVSAYRIGHMDPLTSITQMSRHRMCMMELAIVLKCITAANNRIWTYRSTSEISTFRTSFMFFSFIGYILHLRRPLFLLSCFSTRTSFLILPYHTRICFSDQHFGCGLSTTLTCSFHPIFPFWATPFIILNPIHVMKSIKSNHHRFYLFAAFCRNHLLLL